ncbi:uncharacterized protein LOC117172711 [Belonocnema kinseyi]|uniref:uncharacterized protein LOC117172711 n=1 Tax=Belonocnema kinseyi TaxID=2817044 RepID=UPI00143D9F0B|nr:uncharacterized protein LOC117172711 [Belonocnema kinseyi]
MQDAMGPSNRRRCCVPGCNSRSVPFSFHKFPLPPTSLAVRQVDYVDRCQEWKEKIGITDVSEHTVVCSRHFTEEDYYFPVKEVKQDRRMDD